MSSTTVLSPPLHHVNLKATRLQEMIDWYGTVVGLSPPINTKAGHGYPTMPPITASRSCACQGSQLRRPGQDRAHRDSSHRLRVRLH